MDKFLLQHRRGTPERWANSDIILKDGEIGVERSNGTVKLKVGDGVSKYSELPYGASIAIDQISESSLDGGENIITFSDGKTLTVKNGSRGTDGKDGYSIKPYDKITDILADVTTCKNEHLYFLWAGADSTEFTYNSAAYGEQTKTLVLGDIWSVKVKDFAVYSTTKVGNIRGTNGVDGHTPIKGTDYWTEADKAEIKAYIDELFAEKYNTNDLI